MRTLIPFTLTIAAVLAVSPVRGDDSISYNRDVRSVLSKHCFSCHGPDSQSRQAGLRLDVDEGTDWEEVIRRIDSTDPDMMMPPPEANKPIEASNRGLIHQWVDDGATYEQHWSFVPPVQRAVSGESHPVDFFIDAKLAAAGRSRSAPADPMTLIRRVYLDLIGLPPTPDQADAFAADPSPQAYGEVVDSLLASPRYGERWARRWLDLARYSDTRGYEKDRDRSIWPYRDWVIRAINDDMPFDDFTVAQIAGDMLPDATPDQLVATGFHRNTMLNEEGGIDPLEFRYHAMTDRVATTGTTWLGLTTGCAQCHTHKYDPITHHDYFGMMAYMNNAEEPDYFLPVENAEAVYRENLKRSDQLFAELESHWPKSDSDGAALQKPDNQSMPAPRELEAALAGWIAEQRSSMVHWTTLVPADATANTPYLAVEEDGVVMAGGDTSKHDIYTLEFAAPEFPVHAIRLEAIPDERLPGGGPGMTYYEGIKGDFFLTEFELSTADSQPIKISAAMEDFAKNQFGNSEVSAAMTIDGDIQTGWSVAQPGVGKPHVAIYRLESPIVAGTAFELTMHFGRHFSSSLGKFRISVSDDSSVEQALVQSAPLVAGLRGEDPATDAAVRNEFLMNAPELSAITKQIRHLREPPRGEMTLVMRERPADHPRETFLHHRGEYTQPTEVVPPRLPDAIMIDGTEMPSDRLEFARWLVSRENPLTARVVANRQWAAFFGTGIVSTLDDFGMQGEPPSHPKLLDHLAVEFMNNGWSMKSLHRAIVTSETYQQSSVVPATAKHSGVDRLLGRFPRTRLDAEVIRDASLAASGLLSDKMHGPPVRPPQPVTAVSANYSKSVWRASEGVDRYRRSIYTYQKRTAPFEMFLTFDAGSGEACLARRDVSNTPLQALTLMNDPMFVEIAEAYGERMASMPGDDRARIRNGFRLLLTRSPSETELAWVAGFHAKHHEWAATARVMLCIDEAITKN